ncbi:hypothetical protein ACRRTK_004021 [Alexandromys fortis]
MQHNFLEGGITQNIFMEVRGKPILPLLQDPRSAFFSIAREWKDPHLSAEM